MNGLASMYPAFDWSSLRAGPSCDWKALLPLQVYGPVLGSAAAKADATQRLRAPYGKPQYFARRPHVRFRIRVRRRLAMDRLGDTEDIRLRAVENAALAGQRSIW